jgi:hypothetical protein
MSQFLGVVVTEAIVNDGVIFALSGSAVLYESKHRVGARQG